MICSGAIVSTLLEICFVFQPPSLPAGFVVEHADAMAPPPICIVVGSNGCEELVACNHLGGVIDGCVRGGNELYEVPLDPMPGEVFFITFLEQ